MNHFLSFGLSTVCILLFSLSPNVVQSQIPGGIQRIDVYDPDILKFVNLGRNKYTNTIQPSYEPIIVEVSRATRQVVSGMLYTIDMTFAASTCRRGQNTGCTELVGGLRHKCTVEIWSQPWIDHGSPNHKISCEQSNADYYDINEYMDEY